MSKTENREARPFTAICPVDNFGCQKWSTGQVLVAKFVLLGPLLAREDHFWETKGGPGGPFLAPKIGLGGGVTFGLEKFLCDRPGRVLYNVHCTV